MVSGGADGGMKVTIIDGVMALNIDMKLMMSNIDLVY